MKFIQLTKGYTAVIDDADYAAVSQFSWHAHVCKNTVYARRGYRVGGRCVTQYLHQFLLKCERVDHHDRDGLNNQRDNLRKATVQQNAFNRVQVSGTSPYKGVHRNRKAWRAMIRIDKKKVHIGSYKTELEAAKAYDAMALKIHGEFARLNFPKGEF